MRGRGGCVFCAIVAGGEPAAIVFRDDDVIAFLDHRPLLPGHVLVAPVRHVDDLEHLPEALIAPLFSRVRAVERALVSALGADGGFVALNDRVSQSVPHLHVHVVPRRRGDGLFREALVWKRTSYRSSDEMTSVAERLRAALER